MAGLPAEAFGNHPVSLVTGLTALNSAGRNLPPAPGGGKPVLQAVQVGRGTVVRTGIEGFGARSLRDPDAREFLRQLWSYLRGR